jgi:hypothetical protein
LLKKKTTVKFSREVSSSRTKIHIGLESKEQECSRKGSTVRDAKEMAWYW